MKGISIEKILGMCETVLYFLVVNFYFLVSNLPVLLFFLFVGISQVRTCLPLFLVCMLPFGPSLGAVFYAMNRLRDKRDGRPTKMYWDGYRQDVKQKYQISALHMLAVIVLWTNVEFFSKVFPCLPLVILFGVLFAAVILVTPILYLLATRYRMGNLEIIKNSFFLLVGKPGMTLGNVAVLALVLMCLEIQAGTTVLFMGSVYGYLVVFMDRQILKPLEQKK